MSRLITSAHIEPKVTIELSEREFRALQCIAEFGADVVIDNLSRLTDRVEKVHRDGLWSFFNEIHQNASGVTGAIDRARREFHSGKATQ